VRKIWRFLELEHLSLRALCDWSLEGGGSFTGDPEGYVEKGWCDEQLSQYGPTWENRKGAMYKGF
jgi:hypothetical protein